ncbi:DinB family protein [Pedobacter sp. KBW06]|uniref:DinB family protein n=1 Tax=Pedobacter sp. KBW06 TaxID=2153359 RepID=UPI000F5A078E|nr:DinB family protein [Pedobacter sp. KBW06]RQO74949.1 DinB family protein [Pedobacter sp. KBW06]
MKRTEWFDRKFPVIEDNGLMPGITGRLAGTAARIDELVGGLNTAVLELKPEGHWSIKEEVGHLLDMEPLWFGRIEDVINNELELRMADLTNRKTHEANHNAKDIKLLTGQFREERARLVDRLDRLPDQQLFNSALHPRMKIPMRIVDHAYFVAEHDDHHLAAIRSILLNVDSLF